MRIGIDPGLGGAFAVLDDNLKFQYVSDMPLMALRKKHQQINATVLANELQKWAHDTTVYLEQVNAMPGQGVTSMFSFGCSYGVIQGICGALKLQMVLVHPRVWKKRAGLIGKEKDYSRTLAQQLYPTAELHLKRHCGRADAILIARFGIDMTIHASAPKRSNSCDPG